MYEMRTTEERQQIVAQIEKMRQEGRSVEDACKEVGINASQYYFWKDGKKLGSGNKRMNVPEKDELLKEWMEAQGTGMTMKEFEKSHGMYPTQLYRMLNPKKRHKKTVGARTIVPVQKNGISDEVKALKAENEQLKMLVAELSLDRRSLIEYAGR